MAVQEQADKPVVVLEIQNIVVETELLGQFFLYLVLAEEVQVLELKVTEQTER